MTLVSTEVIQEFIDMLISGILGILGAFLIALAKKGFDWIIAKIDLVKSDNSRQALASATNILEQTVYDTVTSLQQKLGDEIKASLKTNDGKYTRDDLLKLKDVAVQTVMSNLSTGVTEILEGTYADLEAVISDKVERVVREMKEQALSCAGRTLLG